MNYDFPDLYVFLSIAVIALCVTAVKIAQIKKPSLTAISLSALTHDINLIDMRHDKLMKRVQAEVESNAKMRREIIQLRHELLRVRSAVRKPKWVKEDVK